VLPITRIRGEENPNVPHRPEKPPGLKTQSLFDQGRARVRELTSFQAQGPHFFCGTWPNPSGENLLCPRIHLPGHDWHAPPSRKEVSGLPSAPERQPVRAGGCTCGLSAPRRQQNLRGRTHCEGRTIHTEIPSPHRRHISGMRSSGTTEAIPDQLEVPWLGEGDLWNAARAAFLHDVLADACR
jgi:hypothetical protein